MQELRRQDPALQQQIQANQGEFMRMIMEPAEGEGDDMAELLQVRGWFYALFDVR